MIDTRFYPEIAYNNPGEFPREYEQLLAAYYLSIKTCMDSFVKRGFGKSIMGGLDYEKEFDNMNLFHYLAVYLMFISEDVKMDVANGITKTTEEYIESYHLDCIRKNIACTGCNPDNGMNIFGLSRYGQGSLGTAKLTYCGTIGELIAYFKT